MRTARLEKRQRSTLTRERWLATLDKIRSMKNRENLPKARVRAERPSDQSWLDISAALASAWKLSAWRETSGNFHGKFPPSTRRKYLAIRETARTYRTTRPVSSHALTHDERRNVEARGLWWRHVWFCTMNRTQIRRRTAYRKKEKGRKRGGTTRSRDDDDDDGGGSGGGGSTVRSISWWTRRRGRKTKTAPHRVSASVVRGLQCETL